MTSSCVFQVLQFHSRQSYQNKAVPSTGLLFVYIEQADGLPVSTSIISDSYLCSRDLLRTSLSHLSLCRSKRVERIQKWEQRLFLEKHLTKLQWVVISCFNSNNTTFKTVNWPPIFFFKGLWTHHSASVEWGFQLPGPRSQRRYSSC